jgi:NAD(P)-dependent dehydrogenase (short-subunit alcohol dehydrogenase family)
MLCTADTGACTGHQCDFTFYECHDLLPQEFRAMVAKVIATYGRLDCACNNAGIVGKLALIGEQTEDDFDRIIAVNLRGVFLCLRAEIAQMLKSGGGAIVNLSAVAGLIGFAGLSPYAASKHGVNGLTKNAALST